MSFGVHAGGRLHKPAPLPPAAPSSIDGSAHQKPLRKPVPEQAVPRNLPPALAADFGDYLPPLTAGLDSNTWKRHSHYEWTSTPPRPSYSSHESNASSKGNRLAHPGSTLKPPPQKLTPQMLRASASATDLASSTPSTFQKEAKAEKKKKSWFGKSKDNDHERRPGAWIVAPGHIGRIAYDVNGLATGQPVRELWDDSGNCVVHLFPTSSGKDASFRVNSSVFASSPMLTKKAFGKIYSGGTTDLDSSNGRREVSGTSSVTSVVSASTSSSSNGTGSKDVHLWLDCGFNGKPAPVPHKKSLDTPLSDDAETLVGYRNLFAFLCGQSLVATDKHSTMFSIFLRIAHLLQHYDFTNIDGSSFGEVAAATFDSYVSELGLADVRKSSQKTVEMLVLGERMRSVALYNEAFTHAVGKYNEIQRANLGITKSLSSATQTRLQRAAMELEKREKAVQSMLENFDFPAMFAGIATSKTSDEAGLVAFDAWKSSFLKMRSFILSYYKSRWGSWPPKPNPKKNELKTSGLNRTVLRELYFDLSALYDLLVNRHDLTNRTADGVIIEERSSDPPRARALRHLLSEYDRSTPPVKPPIPFDLPLVPDLRTTRPELGLDKKTDAKLLSKSLKSEEVTKLLSVSHNQDALECPFLLAFQQHEHAQAKGSSISQIVDQRHGQWIFLYAVFQALPHLVIDAPGINHTDGVEYFLCQAARGGVPWARDLRAEHKYYAVAGGAGAVVALPSDVVEHSIDGVYRRSHAWVMAERWSREDPTANAALHEQDHRHESFGALPLPPPQTAQALDPDLAPGFRGDASRNTSLGSEAPFGLRAPPTIPAARGEMRVDSRSSSPARSKRESVLNLGLEAVPAPRSIRGISPGRSVSMGDMLTGQKDYFSAESGSGSVGQPGTPGSSRAVNVVDSSRTFDAILGGIDAGKGKHKKK